MGALHLPAGYQHVLEGIKDRIRTARVKAALSSNRELIRLYWDIGRAIVQKQHREGWGKSIVRRLAQDLQASFPGVAGFSPRNVWLMRAFYLGYSTESAKLQQAVAVLERAYPPASVAGIPWPEVV